MGGAAWAVLVGAAALAEPELALRVERHIRAARAAAHELFVHVCKPPDGGASINSARRDEVNVKSCARLKELGLEQYYGSFHMVLAEAWEGKILPALRNSEGETPASLLTIAADGYDPAGGIFISQLTYQNGTLANAALMIGIHRWPQHKARHHVQSHASGIKAADSPTRLRSGVTPAIVERAIAWTTSHQLSALHVCPYGEIRERLQRLGFVSTSVQRAPLRFSHMDVERDVCEESSLMVMELALDAHTCRM